MDKVRVADVAGKGRGLLATKAIERGDLVGEEEPFAFVVIQKHRSKLCHQCANRFVISSAFAGSTTSIF